MSDAQCWSWRYFLFFNWWFNREWFKLIWSNAFLTIISTFDIFQFHCIFDLLIHLIGFIYLLCEYILFVDYKHTFNYRGYLIDLQVWQAVKCVSTFFGASVYYRYNYVLNTKSFFFYKLNNITLIMDQYYYSKLQKKELNWCFICMYW